VASIVQDVV